VQARKGQNTANVRSGNSAFAEFFLILQKQLFMYFFPKLTTFSAMRDRLIFEFIFYENQMIMTNAQT